MRKSAKQDIPLAVSQRETRVIKYYVPGTKLLGQNGSHEQALVERVGTYCSVQ